MYCECNVNHLVTILWNLKACNMYVIHFVAFLACYLVFFDVIFVNHLFLYFMYYLLWATRSCSRGDWSIWQYMSPNWRQPHVLGHTCTYYQSVHTQSTHLALWTCYLSGHCWHHVNSAYINCVTGVRLRELGRAERRNRDRGIAAFPLLVPSQ